MYHCVHWATYTVESYRWNVHEDRGPHNIRFVIKLTVRYGLCVGAVSSSFFRLLLVLNFFLLLMFICNINVLSFFSPSIFKSFVSFHCKMMRWREKKCEKIYEQMRHSQFIEWESVVLPFAETSARTLMNMFMFQHQWGTVVVLSCEKREASLHCNILGICTVDCYSMRKTVSTLQMTFSHSLSHSEIIGTVPFFFVHHLFGCLPFSEWQQILAHIHTFTAIHI